MDAGIVVAGIVAFVILASLIRREPDPIERALRGVRGAKAKSELTENAERSRHIPPPP